MKKIILVTGASSGIGYATVEKLIARGHIVYGGGRKQNDLDKIEGAGAIPLAIEMTDYATLTDAVKKITSEQGKIDVLFNNAGYGEYGTVEDTPIDAAKHQFDVNLFGLARLTQLVLPHMRRQKSGMIISTSSMGGRMYTPLGAWYHATKYALEGWSDCLRLELKDFGIDVVLIEPGVIQSRWGEIAVQNLTDKSTDSAYGDFIAKGAKSMTDIYENPSRLSPPSVIADAVVAALNSKKPKTRYIAGKYARTLILARKYLGDRMFDALIMR